MPIHHRTQASLPRRNYDHRISEAISETRDPDLLPELNTSQSTIRCWLHRGVSEVVTADLIGDDHSELLAENRELRRRVELLSAMVEVLVVLLRVSVLRVDRGLENGGHFGFAISQLAADGGGL
ncbi:MAG: hypothetical protein GY722_07395 [bacterium]|nr:hypothetical protein [bacterium]